MASLLNQLTVEAFFGRVKLILQFVFIVVAGGAVSWFYSKQQKKREQKIALLREFSQIHSRFVSIRYRYNPSFVFWREQTEQTTHPLTHDEIRLQRWNAFVEACELIGQFQSLKPLLLVHFKNIEQPLNELHQYYHDWRRRIIRNQPILQDKSGKNEEKFEIVKDIYQRLMTTMKKQI